MSREERIRGNETLPPQQRINLQVIQPARSSSGHYSTHNILIYSQFCIDTGKADISLIW